MTRSGCSQTAEAFRCAFVWARKARLASRSLRLAFVAPMSLSRRLRAVSEESVNSPATFPDQASSKFATCPGGTHRRKSLLIWPQSSKKQSSCAPCEARRTRRISNASWMRFSTEHVKTMRLASSSDGPMRALQATARWATKLASIVSHCRRSLFGEPPPSSSASASKHNRTVCWPSKPARKSNGTRTSSPQSPGLLQSHIMVSPSCRNSNGAVSVPLACFSSMGTRSAREDAWDVEIRSLWTAPTPF
mmetsp:Transcript_77990/g.216655  ORF Transcript_77990/g.216655 Transcript_77990/m.216655 type:complete len:248 (-) Transcript_77990:599-1342(-)